MENKTHDITLMMAPHGHNTLAHEQLARDEGFVGVFFAAFAIQYYKEKRMDSKGLEFLTLFKNFEFDDSQKTFVKRIIETKNYKNICQFLLALIEKSNEGLKQEKNSPLKKSQKLLNNTANNTAVNTINQTIEDDNKNIYPYEIFLSSLNKGNKSFLIRQIFYHTDQVLEKYRFISDFLNKPVEHIDIEKLFKKMWHLDIEQQILVCVCIFSRLIDNFKNLESTDYQIPSGSSNLSNISHSGNYPPTNNSHHIASQSKDINSKDINSKDINTKDINNNINNRASRFSESANSTRLAIPKDNVSNHLSHHINPRYMTTIGEFFAAFAIQYYLHKEMHSLRVSSVDYLKEFEDIELYASQRVFIKNIISHKKYKIICEEIKYILIEYESKRQLAPHEIFASRLSKEVDINQLLSVSDRLVEKYKIQEFKGINVNDIEMESLHKKVWHFSVEQQILVCIYLFSQLSDNYETKKKPIGESFVENATKIRDVFIAMGRNNPSNEINNFELFIETFKK